MIFKIFCSGISRSLIFELMKKIIFTLIFFGFSIHLFAEYNYFDCKTITESPMFAFPVLNMTKDSITILKINTLLLQLTELNKTIYSSDRSIFSDLYDTSGEVSFGVTSMGFEVLANTYKIFSMALYIEWCVTFCGHWTNYYNYNSNSDYGDLISLYDLIDTNKITQAMDTILEKRITHFMDQLIYIPEGELIDTNSVTVEIKNSLLNYF